MSSGLLARPKWMNQEVYDSINKNIKDGDELIKDLLDVWEIRVGMTGMDVETWISVCKSDMESIPKIEPEKEMEDF